MELTHELDIFTAPNRNSKFWDASTITWGEVISWLDSPGTVKQAGNYVFGRFSGKRRTNGTLRDRCALTLDADFPKERFVERVGDAIAGHAGIWHTTYTSEPEAPRYRVIVPLDRRVDPREYHMCVSALMARVGTGEFDPGSTQGARYMFRPAAQDPEWFESGVWDGTPISADELLAEFDDSSADLPAPKVSRTKRDPFELEGTLGTFNRVYRDLDDLIEAYDLPYEREGADRYRFAGASGASGMGPIDGSEGLFYSHHLHDPAYGQTCNAFDLARLHLYGDLDTSADLKKPVTRRTSHLKMLERAAADPRVLQEAVGEDFTHDMEELAEELSTGAEESQEARTDRESRDPQKWRNALSRNVKTLKVNDEIGNWDLIVANDPAFAVIFRNEMSLATEISADLPWRPLTPGHETFTGGDLAQLMFHVEREYGFRPAKTLVEDVVRATAESRTRNPIREYLEGLKWDGTPRVETCLPGAEHTDYNAMVARKSLVAAVARMMEPGIKWDHMLVIYGTEGLGKTFWIDKMSRGWSTPLGRIGDKDTLLALQRSWIVTSDESHMLKRADFEAQKEFLTRTEDVFRLPYERETQAHKRHCVIWGTTNDEVFLRNQEGNRRFLIVRATRQVDFATFTDEYVDQVWAEAVHLYHAGEQLFLTSEEENMARPEREKYMEEDALAGVIRRYLDTKVPGDWDRRSPESRRSWLADVANGFEKPGTERIDRVCSLQLWVEALGQEVGRHRRVDLLEITAIMKNNPDWVSLPGRHRIPGYGPQQVYERRSPSAELLDELI